MISRGYEVIYTHTDVDLLNFLNSIKFSSICERMFQKSAPLCKIALRKVVKSVSEASRAIKGLAHLHTVEGCAHMEWAVTIAGKFCVM